MLVWAVLAPVLLIAVLLIPPGHPGSVSVILLAASVGVYSAAVVLILRPHDLAVSVRNADHERAYARFLRAVGILVSAGYSIVLILWFT